MTDFLKQIRIFMTSTRDLKTTSRYERITAAVPTSLDYLSVNLLGRLLFFFLFNR